MTPPSVSSSADAVKMVVSDLLSGRVCTSHRRIEANINSKSKMYRVLTVCINAKKEDSW